MYNSRLYACQKRIDSTFVTLYMRNPVILLSLLAFANSLPNYRISTIFDNKDTDIYIMPTTSTAVRSFTL